MAYPLDQNALLHLNGLSLALVQEGMDESDCYAVLTEMLIEHRVIRGRPFILFPQLRLSWNPQMSSDRRSNIPDIGIGRLVDGGKRLQGGAEQKAALKVMRNFPNAADIIDDLDVRRTFHDAQIQASDQVKAAIKNGALPCNIPIKWILAVGPYFTIQHFGPFDEAHLATRGHRPNDSGDAVVADFIESLKATRHSRPISGPLYRIGTPDAASAMHEYLFSLEAMNLYNSTDRRYFDNVSFSFTPSDHPL
ncbi:hypothetical protein M422DRAFT_70811 [Sphaerobolus stellatus SS14]|uniref:Uncharacterized protein n=1 Tax=Sphaerobolus stellatus (strain SS14) TaxID=990650 RepID=A0A0C9V2L1_SPHS4|nr:hypothetical protein M422DRAFT_70811 [Sphaerobolus stellatus SS14]